MFTPDDILRIDNFSTMSQAQLLEIINSLKTDLKNTKYIRDRNLDTLQTKMYELQQEVKSHEILIQKYKEVIARYHKMYNRPLSFKERMTGKIDIKNNQIDDTK